jgi:hypothetical protein
MNALLILTVALRKKALLHNAEPSSRWHCGEITKSSSVADITGFQPAASIT